MKDKNGQISAEFLFLFGVLIAIVMISIVFISSENELNTAMQAARSGVIEGLTTSSSAVYPKDTYNDYSKTKNDLLDPYSVDIVNISYEDLGSDNNYNKKKIRFKVYAKTPDKFSKDELVSIGALAVSFNTTSATNRLYNPVFSPHYVYTTANVKWV